LKASKTFYQLKQSQRCPLALESLRAQENFEVEYWLNFILILNKINIFGGENGLLEFHFNEWLVALVLDLRLIWWCVVLKELHRFEYEPKNIPPVFLQARYLILEIHSVRVYLFHRGVDGHQSLVLVHYLFPVAKRVVEVLQDFIGLKVLLLIVDDSLEASLFTHSLNFIRNVLEAREQVAVGSLGRLSLLEKFVILRILLGLLS